MSTRKKQAAKDSLEDSFKQMMATLKTQVFDAHGEKKIAQTVVDALTLRQTAVQALLARAQTSAVTAEQTFHAGQVVAQTVLNGRVHALAACHQAVTIRDSFLNLYEKAYQYATLAVAASESVADFESGIEACKAKNDYISSDVADSTQPMLDKSQTALAAALVALQSSMLALASAEEAVLAAQTVLRESNQLCHHLLPQAGPQPQGTDAAPLTNLRQYALYQETPPSLDHLVKDLPKAAAQGLLYLLDAIRQVRDFICDEMNGLNSEIDMELNTARHVLDKAARLYDNLRASMNAATAAI